MTDKKKEIVYGYYCGDIFPECEWEEYSEDMDDLIEEIKFHLEKKHNVFEFKQELMAKIKSVIAEMDEDDDDYVAHIDGDSPNRPVDSGCSAGRIGEENSTGTVSALLHMFF